MKCIHYSSLTWVTIRGQNSRWCSVCHWKFNQFLFLKQRYKLHTYIEGINRPPNQSHDYLQVNSKQLKNDAKVPFTAEMVKASYNMMLVSLVTYAVQLHRRFRSQMLCCYFYMLKAQPERSKIQITTANKNTSNYTSRDHHKVIATATNQHWAYIHYCHSSRSVETHQIHKSFRNMQATSSNSFEHQQ